MAGRHRRRSTELPVALWRLIAREGEREDRKMVFLLWVALPAIIVGSGSFFLWSIHKLEFPTM
jgi:hypothetical protein